MHLIFIPLLIAVLAPWQPRPSDADMIRSEAFYVQTFPHGDKLTVTGYLPTPCNELRIDRTGHGLDVYSVLNPAVICMQTLTYFAVDIPVEKTLGEPNTITGIP